MVFTKRMGLTGLTLYRMIRVSSGNAEGSVNIHHFIFSVSKDYHAWALHGLLLARFGESTAPKGDRLVPHALLAFR
jgi:hypothetical protein